MKADIAIITTREDEFESILQRFKPVPYREPGKRSYGICRLETKGENHYTIAVARCSEQGNDTSQQLAHVMIHDLNPRLILVVGIADGVPHDEFTLGDVIVSSRIHNLNVGAQYEDGSSTFDIRGGIHPAISEITSSLLLYQDQLTDWNTLASVGQKRPSLDPQQAIIGGDEEWRKKVQASLDLHFGTQQGQGRLPKFKAGSIASSNHLMRNPLILKQWREIARTIVAVEMEAAGIYQAAQAIERQYPVMAIRGISDIVGLERDARWTAYACQTAAAFAYAFLQTDSLDSPKSANAAKVPRQQDNSSDLTNILLPRKKGKHLSLPLIMLSAALFVTVLIGAIFESHLIPGRTFSETTGGNTSTWTDYSSGGGNPGPAIPSHTTVQIICKVTGLRVKDGDTWWYRIASSPWDNKYYASADAFYNNGQTSGPFTTSLLVDNKVPNC